MIIIVEGIDRVGKTTLCEQIELKYAETLGFLRFRDDSRYVHTHRNKAVNTEKINTLQNLIEAGLVDNIILDRYHITEFVYGACDRNYRNNDMIDIDRRLVKMASMDTASEEVEEIDPGMTFDGHIYNEVILIYVVPMDAEQSSFEHGKNLERHIKWFDDFFDNITMIGNRIKVDYSTLGLALDFIDEVLGIKIPEAPGGPSEPTGPSEIVPPAEEVPIE